MQRVLCAQAGLLTASLCALVLAALFAERKSNEAHLAHSNLMLERERDNKLMNVQAATATMAHEVKQPLTVISLKGEAAQRLLKHAQPDLEKVRSALVSIVANSHRAGQLLNNTRSLFEEPVKYTSQSINKNFCRRCAFAMIENHGVMTEVDWHPIYRLSWAIRGNCRVMINLFKCNGSNGRIKDGPGCSVENEAPAMMQLWGGLGAGS